MSFNHRLNSKFHNRLRTNLAQYAKKTLSHCVFEKNYHNSKKIKAFFWGYLSLIFDDSSKPTEATVRRMQARSACNTGRSFGRV